MFLISSCHCLCPIHWSQVLSQEWRCSWSSADRQCSNYIWVINKFIAYFGVAYMRDLTVHLLMYQPAVLHNMTCHPGGHYLDYYTGALSLSQVTTTHWVTGIHEFHLQVPDLQMTCRDLTIWLGVRIVARAIATRGPSQYKDVVLPV